MELGSDFCGYVAVRLHEFRVTQIEEHLSEAVGDALVTGREGVGSAGVKSCIF